MDQRQTCQICEAPLPEKPAAKNSVKCPECGYVNLLSTIKEKTLSDQLAEITIDLDQGNIEATFSTLSECLGLDKLENDDIGATIKTSSDRIIQYVSQIKRKSVGSADKETGHSDYKLIEKIGKGGMGVVYLAKQSSLNRDVALKMTKEDRQMTDGMIEHFLTEALVTGDFDHPNVVPIHDAGIDYEGRLFYSMKRVQGITWESLLHPKTEEEIQLSKTYTLIDHLYILNSVCNAVAFAHSKNVIHRDLKPSNVMIGEFGEVIVLDWGLAVSIGYSNKVTLLEKWNAFGGTASYMAPEMAKGQSPQIGKHSDIYLLGAILYEILTGKPPHPGKNMKEAIINAMQNKIQPPENEQDIDMFLMETALKAMSSKPLQRFFTVDNFQRALKRFIRGKSSHITSVQLSQKGMSFINKGLQEEDVKTLLRGYILLERALRLWNGNREAEIGKHRAEHFMLRTAYKSAEIDLLVSFMKEKSLHIDFKLQMEKDKYIRFRINHPVISFIFSRNLIYRFLYKLDHFLITVLTVLNRLLRLFFFLLLLVLPLVLHLTGAPMYYVVSFTLFSILVMTLGELIWRKSAQKKRKTVSF